MCKQDIIRLYDRKDYPLWCVQVRNELRTKRCEEAIQDNFEMPLRQTAVEALLDEGWRLQDCNDVKLVSNKLNSLKDIYEKVKGDSIGVIQGRLHRNTLILLEGRKTAREMWVLLQQVFDSSRALDIGAIAATVIGKDFHEFDSVSNYCQAYQKAYDEIASRLVGNKGGRNQNKHYEVLLQGAMLENLPEAYASLVATMDTEWTDYAYADLGGTIRKILQFLKTDLRMALHATTTPSSGQSKKRRRLALASPPCSNPIRLSKKSQHPIENCWELYPELRPTDRRTKKSLQAAKMLSGDPEPTSQLKKARSASGKEPWSEMTQGTRVSGKEKING